jgi:mannose-6-phosphate isomerase-like protein (cupin superfamily)
MISLEEFENFIHLQLPYEQKIISVIDNYGRQITLNHLAELYRYSNCTIKLEQMEKYNSLIFKHCQFLTEKHSHKGPITCHLFRSFKDSKSFALHTDPDHVIIECIFGKKKIILNGKEKILFPGESLFIPANTPHEATNDDESLTLSFGLEKFYTEKINYGLGILS